jgi:predicted RNA binding protein YcfA (HicA-like mRNA interferase family)
MAQTVKNISLKDFREFLLHNGLKKIRTSGGHEVWSRNNLTRPVIIQTHKDPIPIFIIKNNLRTMGLTIDDMRDYLEAKR